MKALVQRVDSAAVILEDGSTAGEIGKGLLLLVGFGRDDGRLQVEWMAEKVAGLRVFADDNGRMNRSVNEVGGATLVVSQFTLYGDASKGRRPSFVKAAPPHRAKALYLDFVVALRERCVGEVATGEFGAYMLVRSTNAGPVTLWLER